MDVHNAVLHLSGTPLWQQVIERGVAAFAWPEDDPLADTFLAQFGDFPAPDEVGIDYLQILRQSLPPHRLFRVPFKQDGAPILPEVLDRPCIRNLSSIGLKRHHSIRAPFQHAYGLFLGDSSSLADLVDFWNLRAADIPLSFHDPKHASRYVRLVPEYLKSAVVDASRIEGAGGISVWGDEAHLEQAREILPGAHLVLCRLSSGTWHESSIKVPMMYLGEESALGVVGDERGAPSVSFALKDKPFNSNSYFHTQHLVASLSFLGRGAGNATHTFNPPYLPELNEFAASSMNVIFDKVRCEPERLGLVVSATRHDVTLSGLAIAELVRRIFDDAGIEAKPSIAGLVTRQVIARLGGVDGAKPFKIPGVRLLIKTYGPNASFTRNAALRMIGGRDPKRPEASFKQHERLFIEERPIKEKLTPEAVFAYLVAKGLFRIGVDLVCPTCSLTSWTSVDDLRQKAVCGLCGTEHDATRQLVEAEFRYRRTGVLGLDRNAHGAVPVVLTLQQLSANIHSLVREIAWLPSMDLIPKAGSASPKCEVDFIGILFSTTKHKTELVLGECKDAGGAINATDIENPRKVADAFSPTRFDVYIVFAKLSSFSPEEVALARSLNMGRRRVILLTDQELEPYNLYDRTLADNPLRTRGGNLEGCALVTSELYFKKQAPVPPKPPAVRKGGSRGSPKGSKRPPSG